MSEITEAKTSLKKILLLINEISNISSDSLTRLGTQPDKILESIELLEQEKNNNLKTIDSNIDEINTLKNQITEKQRAISQLEEEGIILVKERDELSVRIKDAQADLLSTKNQIKTVSDELENRTARLNDLSSNLDILRADIDRFDEKLKSIESELKDTYIKRMRFVESYENRVAAMKILIHENYITSWQYQLIKSLQKDSTLELKNILLAADIREDQARRLLKTVVEENGPVVFDEIAGTVKLLKEVDFQ